jgi:hypothetical protein
LQMLLPMSKPVCFDIGASRGNRPRNHRTLSAGHNLFVRAGAE